MAQLTKAIIDHVKSRVRAKTMCVNGEIKSRINEQMMRTEIPFEEKIRLISSGELKLRDDVDDSFFLSTRNLDAAIEEVFDIESLPQMKVIVEHNTRLEQRMTEAQLTVEHHGERLIDDVVVGNINQSDIPEKLEELSKLVETIL